MGVISKMKARIIGNVRNADFYIFECSLGFGYFEYSGTEEFIKGDVIDGNLDSFGDCLIKKEIEAEHHTVYIQCYDAPSVQKALNR